MAVGNLKPERLARRDGAVRYRHTHPKAVRITDAGIVKVNRGPVPACAEDGAPMHLRRSRHGVFYSCTNWPRCRGSHGAHPNGEPLGVPATAAGKALRVRAHELLESKFGRVGYFPFLMRTLGIGRAEAHVAMLSEEQLQIIIETLEGHWDEIS